MENKHIKLYRLRLLKWGKGIIAVCITGALAYTGTLTFKKPVQKKSHKMLTEDGVLVEIDPQAIVKTKQKIKSEEIHHWIKR
jgi:hypothetical protein